MLKLVTRGKLIVLEGLDRSGKSSVTKSIREPAVDGLGAELAHEDVPMVEVGM